MADPRTLIIIPAFNEADAIGPLIHRIHALLPGLDILVIDDGSTDATAARIPPGLATVICLPFNLGIGGAMQTGYRYAAAHRYDLALQLDADGQHPPEEVPKLMAAYERTHADLIVGSRFLRSQETEDRRPQTADQPISPPPSAISHPSHPPAPYPQTTARMIAIRLIALLLRLLTGQRFTDPTSGFRLASTRVIHAFAHFYPDDYPEPEVLLMLKRASFTIAEAPVHMLPRTTGQTSIPFFRGLFYLLKVSAALILDTLRHPWPAAKLQGPGSGHQGSGREPRN
jgi:glycosyltransferase involved in cell wall biosynthesis